MSGLCNSTTDSGTLATPPANVKQITRNNALCEQWQQDRLVEARGVLADVAHHPETLVVLACRVICTHGSDTAELADALGVMRLLNAPSPETASAPRNGGVA